MIDEKTKQEFLDILKDSIFEYFNSKRELRGLRDYDQGYEEGYKEASEFFCEKLGLISKEEVSEIESKYYDDLYDNFFN